MPNELKTGKLEVGEAQRRSLGGLLVVKWMDKKWSTASAHVILTSTTNQLAGLPSQLGNVQNGWKIMKPKMIMDYNNGMLAVDRQDQVLAYDPVIRRYSKGYKKLFFYMFEHVPLQCVCSILPNKKEGKSHHFVDFKIGVAEQMLASLEQRARPSPGRPSTSNPMRLQGRHFPQSIPPTPQKEFPTKRCAVCKEHGLRKESRIQCKQCVVGLHIECFEVYHTLQKF
ncbi:piggyBac transposable element-derived protein 4-like [Homalodisca vitripennis]|uniref:piggyBac transposable element-derived protein 4-like n=1 Tax=Homalodisca vitripennis TaxID=197043 RepID=UPI001EEA8C17|nr:piggyBac transposable element-derived protein 4-like [Homalodisca vitripennis]